MMIIIRSPQDQNPMQDQTAPAFSHGTVPLEVLASMAGIDLVRGVFDGTLPQPPIIRPSIRSTAPSTSAWS
jgi:hypothetical protein